MMTSEKGFTSIGKNLLLMGAIVDPLLGVDPNGSLLFPF